MNKSDLLVLKEIVSQRYINEPKSSKKTEKGYLKDVITTTFESLKAEGETVDIFNEALNSIKTDPIHSGGFFRELLQDATEKYVSVVSPFDSPEKDDESESDEKVLKRLGIPIDSVDTSNDSVKTLIDAQRKNKKSEYGKREIQEMKERHFQNIAPVLFPSELTFYPKKQDVENNTPVSVRGWHWGSTIQSTIGNDWVDLLKENDLLDLFSFTGETLETIAKKAKKESEINEERKNKAFGETESESE